MEQVESGARTSRRDYASASARFVFDDYLLVYSYKDSTLIKLYNFAAGLGVTERTGTGREKMGGQDNWKGVQDQAAEATTVVRWDPLPLQCLPSCSLGQADHTSTSNRQ